MESGYVRYYKDPKLHPKRQYIGVALEKDHQLPYPEHAARRRRLNMIAVRTEPPAISEVDQLIVTDAPAASASEAASEAASKVLRLRRGKGYAYREANWEIGRAAEKANVQVKKFIPGNRWAAWRKSRARIAKNQEAKRLKNASKKASKPKARKTRG